MMYKLQKNLIYKTLQKVRILLAVTLYLISARAFSQHDISEVEQHGHGAPYQKVTIIMANSLITNHVTENSEGIFVIPKNWKIFLFIRKPLSQDDKKLDMLLEQVFQQKKSLILICLWNFIG